MQNVSLSAALLHAARQSRPHRHDLPVNRRPCPVLVPNCSAHTAASWPREFRHHVSFVYKVHMLGDRVVTVRASAAARRLFTPRACSDLLTASDGPPRRPPPTSPSASLASRRGRAPPPRSAAAPAPPSRRASGSSSASPPPLQAAASWTSGGCSPAPRRTTCASGTSPTCPRPRSTRSTKPSVPASSRPGGSASPQNGADGVWSPRCRALLCDQAGRAPHPPQAHLPFAPRGVLRGRPLRRAHRHGCLRARLWRPRIRHPNICAPPLFCSIFFSP